MGHGGRSSGDGAGAAAAAAAADAAHERNAAAAAALLSAQASTAAAATAQQPQPQLQPQPDDALLAQAQYQPFLAADFSAAEFTSRVLAASRGTTAHAQAEQLRGGVRALEAALASAVVSRHGELLGHARRLHDAEASARELALSVAALQAAARRVRAEIEGPHAAVRLKTRQLRALHATIEVLRALLLRLKLTAKLRQQLQPPQTPQHAGAAAAAAAAAAPPPVADPAKAARLLADIAAASTGADGRDLLAGVELAAADAPFLERAGAVVREQAQAALAEGVEALSQAAVGAALQVFFNLGELRAAVDGAVAARVHDLDRAARAALDSRQLSLALGAGARGAQGSGGPGGARGVTLPQPGAGASWQERLWQGVRALCDVLVAGGVAAWHVQRVAAKKRDPLTHALFLDELLLPPHHDHHGQDHGEAAAESAARAPLPTEAYWSEALRVLGEAFAAAARPSKGGFVREALSAGYPRLAAALEAAFARLQQETRARGAPAAVGPGQLPALLAAAAPFRDAYLAAALGRLQDAVGAAFPGGGRGLPSPADVQKLVAAAHEELRAAGASALLAGQVAGVVGKALQQAAQRAEYMAAAGPDLRALALQPLGGGGGGVGGSGGAGAGATPAQQRNIALASQVQEVHRSLTTLLPRLPPTAAAALEAPLEALNAVALDAVAPLFRALAEGVEARLTGVHDLHAARWGRGGRGSGDGGGDGGDGGGDGGDGGAAMMATSAYVADAAAALAAFRAEYLVRFAPPPAPGGAPSAAAQLCERTAGRLLAYFVRHATLLRPLPPPAKLQLAKDLAELQAAVGQALWPLEALGPAVRCLRGFRALLFVDDAALDAAAAPLRDLPLSIALHHLFSRLPPSIQAPHERSALTPVQYSRWLDQHSVEDVAKGVAAALEAACSNADTLGDAGQRRVLDVMSRLCASTLAGAATKG